jgi:hypothetical protein
MSAWHIRFDWRVERATAAIEAGTFCSFAHYAEIFEMDEEETMEVFQTAAIRLGVPFCPGPAPVLS